MLEKTRTVVNICGKEYAMVGTDSEEYIHRVAILVDRKMGELKSGSINMNTADLAVLAALNIADDYLKLKYEFGQVSAELAQLKEEVKKARIENALLREEKKENVMALKKEHANKVFDSYK